MDRNQSLKLNVIVATIVAILCFLTLFTFSVQATENTDTELSIKQMLLMPGKLTQAHQKIEAECEQCHQSFDKQNQTGLCLDCHKKVAKDVQQQVRFHGNLSSKQQNNCVTCHSDHLGRDADIRNFNLTQFHHQQTGVELKGQHALLDCAACHKNSEQSHQFRLKNTDCESCHKTPHRADFSSKCESCHNQTNWHKTEFDHNKTKFKLTGGHQGVACNACHVDEISKPLVTECVACHQGKDPHFGVFGQKCQQCHNSKKWQDVTFDHQLKTHYALLGKHQKLECVDCHASKAKIDNTCVSCHQVQDVHAGSNGKECQQCHNQSDWKKTKFDHNKDTQFALLGSHQDIACEACHFGEKLTLNKQKSTKKPRICNECHQANDVHQQNLGKHCEQCHNEQQWQQVSFEHDFTQFPLMGSHAVLACESCHISKTFKVEQSTCISCHQFDDTHQGVMGNKCADCHNAASWQSWQFNHNQQTHFNLDGAHQNLSCNLCHQADLAKPLNPGKQCIDCHKADDVHLGAFGQNCEKCHSTERFNHVQP